MYKEGITEEEIEIFHSMHSLIADIFSIQDKINIKLDNIYRRLGQVEAVTVNQGIHIDKTLAEIGRAIKSIDSIRSIL